MKKIIRALKVTTIICIIVLTLAGCGDKNISTPDTTMNEASDQTMVETEESEGINFTGKTLVQIMPGFPEDLIQLIDKNELMSVTHKYFFPENFSSQMTGATRDTCYSIQYAPNDKQSAYEQYINELGGSPGEDPNEFQIVKGDYLFKIRMNPYADIIEINCFTNLGKVFAEEKLDEVISRCSPGSIGIIEMQRDILVQKDCTSYSFQYEYDGEDEAILDFYRNLIPNCKEETRNEVVYIEDSIVGLELAQYVTISPERNTVDFQEVIYQMD